MTDPLGCPESPLPALRVHGFPTVIATTCACAPRTATDWTAVCDGQMSIYFV